MAGPCPLSKGSREESISSTFRKLQACGCITLVSASVFVRGPICVCLFSSTPGPICIHLFSSQKDISHIGLEATLPQCDLMLPKFMHNDPSSKSGPIHTYQELQLPYIFLCDTTEPTTMDKGQFCWESIPNTSVFVVTKLNFAMIITCVMWCNIGIVSESQLT